MGKIIAAAYISLDGFFLSGQLAWLKPDAEMSADDLGLLDTADTVLLDTQAYREMSYYWPTVTDQSPPDERAFAKKIHSIQKLVITEEPLEATWENTTIHTTKYDRSEVFTEVAEESAGTIIVYGSPDLLQISIRSGLVSQYRFLICPIIAGSGMPVAGKLDKEIMLKLERTKQYGNGVTLLEYSS